MIRCSRTSRHCQTPDACDERRLVVCPMHDLKECHVVRRENEGKNCRMHDLCPAYQLDAEGMEGLREQQREIYARKLRFGGLDDLLAMTDEQLLFDKNVRITSCDDYPIRPERLDRGETQHQRDAAVYDQLLANERIGSWLSAALGDPQSCDEFRREIERWMDADATLRQLFGVVPK